MPALSIVLMTIAILFIPAKKGLSAETNGNSKSFFSQFKDAYNDEVNSAHFKGALVDAALLRRTITIFYLQNSTFPTSLENANYRGIKGKEAVSAELGENGAFQVQLAELFGSDKYIAMRPIIEDNEISEWTCHSNVSAGIMKDTFCSTAEE